MSSISSPSTSARRPPTPWDPCGLQCVSWTGWENRPGRVAFSASSTGLWLRPGRGTERTTPSFLGFLGESPETVEVAGIPALLESVRSSSMHFMALDRRGEVVAEDLVPSLGGGFIANDSEFDQPARGSLPEIPYPYNSGAELLEHCQEGRLSIG